MSTSTINTKKHAGKKSLEKKTVGRPLVRPKRLKWTPVETQSIKTFLCVHWARAFAGSNAMKLLYGKDGSGWAENTHDAYVRRMELIAQLINELKNSYEIDSTVKEMLNDS